MNGKAASNNMFMFLSSLPALADDIGKEGIFSLNERTPISDEQLNTEDEIYADMLKIATCVKGELPYDVIEDTLAWVCGLTSRPKLLTLWRDSSHD